MRDGVYDLLGFAPEDLVESERSFTDLIHPETGSRYG